MTPTVALEADANAGPIERIWGEKNASWLVPLVAVACLAPFVSKAFTIDDPLFLWLGAQIQSAPLDFFGFDVNWYGARQPMSHVTMNPPLTGYFLALAAGAFGWSETALHIAFLLPAGAAALAIFKLARRLCASPLEAGLIAVFTPVFLVSSTNVMSDTLMLALWTGALWAWVRGMQGEGDRWLWVAGSLGALTVVTKLFGVSLAPLFLVHGLLVRRRPGAWMAAAALPLVSLVGYELLTLGLYGTGQISSAIVFATGPANNPASFGERLLVGLAFAGACSFPMIAYAPLLWRRRSLVWVVLLVLAAAPLAGGVWLAVGGRLIEPFALDAGYMLQLAAHIAAGLSLLALILSDLRRERTPDSVLLALWILGAFVFSSLVNWTNNGRSNLPMIPAVGILIVRALARHPSDGSSRSALPRLVALGVSAAVGLAVCWGDFVWANQVRTSARELAKRHLAGGRSGFSTGHWGFQYYIEQAGGVTLDWMRDTVEAGQVVLTPMNNTAVKQRYDTRNFKLIERFRPTLPGCIRTMSAKVGAGFYSADVGLLPYVLSCEDVDAYRVDRARGRIRLKAQGGDAR